MSDGKVIHAAETSMAGVVGYRKLGGRLGGIVACVANAYCKPGCRLTIRSQIEVGYTKQHPESDKIPAGSGRFTAANATW
jgi:hypothetical protein